MNTIFDDDLPLVISSQHTVTNTVTAPDDYLSLLQPSEHAIPVTDTNTYYNTMHLSKTLTEADDTRIITTKEIQTQVVITESLPPRAGLLGFEDIVSVSDIVKTYFVTYTYYNTYLEANNSTLVRVNVSTSSDIVTEQISFYSKKTTPPSFESQTKLSSSDDSEYFSSEIDDIHIYAPKTYLTTFTFFTTLVTDSKHSTVINSHTKVIENVVTETMSAHLLPSDVVNDIRNGLLTQDGITTVVNIDNQPIPITAVNLIKKVTDSPQDNEIEESENNYETVAYDQPNDDETVNEEENYTEETADEPIKNVQNVPANKVSVPPISNFISSLGFSPFSNALGPVINAMAGLIQTKWGRNTTKVNANHDNENIPQYIHHPNALNDDSQNRSPLYIPVSEDETYPSETQVSYNELNNFNSYKPHAEKWVSEEDQRKNIEVVISKPTVETSLLNGGIQISPGQVITANSDVIVGKPGAIGPRLPHAVRPSNEIPIGMQPPPLPTTLPQNHFNQGSNKKQPTPQSSLDLSLIENQNIYQPPPISPPSSIKLQKNYKPYQSTLSHNLDVHHQSPHTQHQQHDQYSYGQNVPSSAQSYRPQQIPVNDVRGPPQNKNFFNSHQSSPLTFQQMKSQQSNEHSFAKGPHFPEQIFNHQRDEIIEIQRVPEVYSTDLPPVNVKIYPAVHSSMQDSLLVNIQPSQVANVLIPHGSTTALIFGGVIQPHTSGQYFDDPLLYPDVKVFHDAPIKDAHTYYENTIHVNTYHPYSKTISDISPTNSQRYSHAPNTQVLVGSSSINNVDQPIHYKSEKTLVEMKIPHNSNSINVQLSPNPIIVPSNNANYQRHYGPVTNQYYQTTQRVYSSKPLHPIQINHKNINDNIEKFIETASTNFASFNNTLYVSDDDEDEIFDGHKQDDIENEDGEVIQESNTLPLRPGQVPLELSDTTTHNFENSFHEIYDSTLRPPKSTSSTEYVSMRNFFFIISNLLFQIIIFRLQTQFHQEIKLLHGI